ncbi:C-type lectin domain family 6 member A-like isoform X2 [Tachysurus fulvidraco]|uniref:C-type lectin domain family 6 member A-like isoform X2 n=1 Tax=Tachysurus fulvidraco TaxID=1234273 RepID=UPI001FF00FE8|nr:C-type lectin domain family 6 member A-like isoform X2 [Tachysurus fulvidraco]
MSFDHCKMDSIENYHSPTDTEDDIYVNTEDCRAELKKTVMTSWSGARPRHKNVCNTLETQNMTGSQAVDDDNVNTQQLHLKTKQCTASSRYNNIISALGLLLLGALASLCAVGILYHNKVVSTEILSEGHENTTAELMVLQYKATEKRIGMLKAKYQQAHERLSACNGKQTCTLCEEGWKSLGLKCYYFSNHKLNWTQSRDYCVEKGGHLVIITSQTEQGFLISQIGETHWIGLNDLETEGQWMWVNNQPLKETGVTFWFSSPEGPKQPDNWTKKDPSGENCAALGDANVNIHTWFDDSCSTIIKCICEK